MKKRNPHWLEGTGRRFSVQAAPGFRSDREKDDALALSWTGGIEHETPAEAARRRRAEKRAKKAARVARLVKAAKSRPKSLATRARELGGIAWSSWADPATRTYPGETGADWRRAAPGVFRGKPPRFRRSGFDPGMSWEALAQSLREEGYGPQGSAADGEGSGDSSWFLEVLDAQAAGETYSIEGQQSLAEQQQRQHMREQSKRRANPHREPKPPTPKHARRFASDRQEIEALAGERFERKRRLLRELEDARAAFAAGRGTAEWIDRVDQLLRSAMRDLGREGGQGAIVSPETGNRARYRRRNPLLLTLTNPSKTATRAEALAAFRKFHETDPKDVSRLPGDGPPLICLGDLVEIVYRPTRGARRGPAFVHKFGPGARVAATVDGEHLVLLPNPRRPFRVDWSKGIVG